MVHSGSKHTTQQAINNWLKANVTSQTLLMVCGGSAAKIFAKAWETLPVQQQNLVTITLTDERFGKVGHHESNWKQLQSLGVDLSSARHIQVLYDGLSIEDTADRWEITLSDTFKTVENILAVFGIGEDSHIAGLKAGSPLLQETNNYVGAYRADDFERISITPVIFPMIQNAIVFASGEIKRAAIDLLKQDLDASQYPDQLIKQTAKYTVYYQP